MSQIILNNWENFEKIFSEIGSEHMLLVSDKSFQFLPEKVRNIYNRHKESITVFNDFYSNPLYEQVCNGVNLFREMNCDSIIAIGGGSTIDVAKCIKLYCKMDKSKNYLSQEYKDSGIPLIALPTTAGTGSESTRYAVIYYKGEKQSVTHNSIIPDYVLLEPSVLKTLPLNQKKSTMLDALCQGIESWWSVNSTDESKKLSSIAIRMIVENYRNYLFYDDETAAEKIMTASNYSGQAINITQTTAAHAMSYKITSLYKLPHGHAVAVCLPVVWRYIINNKDKCIDPRGSDYLQKILDEIPLDVESFENIVQELNMESPVASDRKKEMDILTGSVNETRLKNNPVFLSKEVLREMYERIVK